MPLIIDCKGYTYYDGQLIPNKPSRYTAEEKLEILDTHPFFTGICPQCRHKFDGEGRCFASSLSNRHVEQDNLSVHFDCPNCGWIDDSV